MAMGKSDAFIEFLTPLFKRQATTEEVVTACFNQFKYTPHIVTVRRWRKKLGLYAPAQRYVQTRPKIKFPMDPEELACIQLHQKLNQLWKSPVATIQTHHTVSVATPAT